MKLFNDFAINVRVSIPALDRLMDFLEAAQQHEVDAITARVGQSTSQLTTSQTALQGAINSKEK